MKNKVSFVGMSARNSQRLNITSLMDVLTIILIFLLVNYSDVEQDMQVPDYIKMPVLNSPHIGSMIQNIKIVVAKDRIKIDDRPEIRFKSYENQQDNILDQVAKILDTIQLEQNNKKVAPVMAIQADEKIPYFMIDGIILSAASVGITQVQLMTLKKQD